MPTSGRKPKNPAAIKLRVNTLTPLTHFAILYLTTLSEIEEFISAGDSLSHSPPTGLKRVEQYTPAWPTELTAFFTPSVGEDSLKQLRVNHQGAPTVDVYSFMRLRTEQFFKQLANHNFRADDGPLEFFHKFSKDPTDRGRLEDAFKKLQLSFKVSVKPSDLATLSRLQGKVFKIEILDEAKREIKASFDFSALLERNFPPTSYREHTKIAFEALMLLCVRLLESRFNQRPIHSRFLPGISLRKVDVLASKILPLHLTPKDHRQQSGFFGVLREARGTVTNFAPNQNCVVRDLLWLHPQSQPINANGIVDSTNMGFGCRLGYYVSAFDSLIYEVKAIRIQDNYLMLDAVAHLNNSRIKSMCIYFPLMPPSPLRWSFGSIIGHTRPQHQPTTISKRTGAWSAIFYRPEWDERYSNMLNNELAIYSESLRRDEEVHYNSNIVRLYDLLEHEKVVGILTSRLLLSDEARSDRSQRLAAAKAFRSFFQLSEDYHSFIENDVSNKINEIKGDVEKTKKYILNMILEQYMYCLTPSFDPLNVKDDQFDDEIKMLSDRNLSISSSEYFQQYEKIG